MGCVRFITPKIGPNKGKRVRSELYNDLFSKYGGRIADDIYGNIFSEKFKRSFGDWEIHKDKWKNKLDKNGEPLSRLIASPHQKSVQNITNPDAFYVPDTTTQINLEKEKAWFREKLGDTVDLSVVDGLIEGHLMGQFHKGGVYLYENAIEGVLYHEAFHAVTQVFLTRMERTAIYDEYRRRSAKNKNLSVEQIEEALADEFSEYVRSNGTYIVPEAGKKQKGFFRRLLDSIVGLFYNNDISIRDLYKNINAGKYAKGISLSRRAENFFNKYEMKTYAKRLEIPRITATGEETLLTPTEIRMLLNSMTYYFLDTVLKEGNPLNVFAKGEKEIGQIYNGEKDYTGVLQRMKSQLLDDLGREEDGFFRRLSGQSGENIEDLRARVLSIWDAIGLTNNENLENWNELVKEHIKQLKLYGIDLKQGQRKKDEFFPVIEEEAKEEKMVEGTSFENGRNFWEESIYFDPKNGMSHMVRMLVASLAQVNSGGVNAINDLGLRIPVNYSKTFNKLAEELAGTPARWGAFERKLIRFEDEVGNNYLSEKLQLREDPSQVTNDTWQLRIHFMQSFAKNKYEYIIGLIKKDIYDEKTGTTVPGDIVFINSNSNSLNRRIRENWQANLDRNLAEIGGENSLGALLEEVKEIMQDYRNERIVDERKNLLNNAFKKLGIELSPRTADYITKGKSEGGGVIKEEGGVQDAYTVLESMVTYLDKEVDLYGPKSGVAEWISNLINMEAKYNEDNMSLQHLSPDGKTVYGITLNSNISLTIGELNEIAALGTREEREIALEEHLPHIANSIYAEHSLLKEEILEGRPITFGIAEGYKYDQSGEIGLPTKELQESDKYSQFFNSTLEGFYSFMRTADRGLENTISLQNNKRLLLSELAAIEQFKRYLIDEITTARHLSQEGAGADISFYQNILKPKEEGESPRLGLRVFDEIITDPRVRNEIRSMIAGDYTYEDILAVITEDSISDDLSISGRINRDIITYFNKRKKEEKKKLEELGIYKIGANGKIMHVKGLSMSAVGGNTLADIESSIEEYIWNSTAAYIEQSKLFFGDLAFFKGAEEAFKRFSMYNSTKKVSAHGNDLNDYLNRAFPRSDGKITSRDKITTVVFEDVVTKVSSEYEETLKKVFTDSLLQDTNSNGQKIFTSDGKTLNGAGKVKLAGLIKPYLKMEEADAQGFITLDEYRDLMIRAGDWTMVGKNSHEAVYQKAINGTPISHTELFYLQPLKTQYTGPLIESSLSETMSSQGLYVPTGYKHSLLPLIPSVFKGAQMQELITKMKDNQWGIAQFRSGNKFGTVVDITGKTNEFYKEIEINGKEKWVINTDNLITQVIDYKYMGIQQDILPEIKKDSTVGVQQRRIIQSNLFENGKIAPGAEDLVSIVEEYNNVQKEITKGELSAFMEEMSIKAVDGVYKITDGTKFIDFLTRAAEERASSQNILDSIAALHLYDEETGESIGIDKLDLVISQEKIENLLMALVNNTVIREKRTGGSKVQAASTGFELRARSKEGGIFVSEELSFYKEDENGKLLGMEVAIPAPPALLSAYGTIDNLNKALERGELDHIKNLMGYRIPTQAPGSIDFMQIKKFLPTEAGDIIVLPAAIVAKAGSDFDIDKMNIFMKEFELNYKEEEKVTLTEDSNTKEWKQNRLIDLSIDILSHPYVRRQLFTAINTELMVGDQGIVTDIRNLKRKEKEEVSLTKVVEGNHNQDMFFYFLSGKTGVGQDAVHIAHHPLTQRAGTYIQTEQGNEKAPIRLFFEHNEIEIEGQKYPSLAGIRDVSGREWITDSLSNFMNGYLDIAKDPFIFELNARTDTNNTIFYMLRLGADPRWLARFLTQPVIENYIKERAVQDAEFNKRSGEVDPIWVSFEKVLRRMGKDISYYDKASHPERMKINSIVTDRLDPYYTDKELSTLIDIRNKIEKKEQNYRIPTYEELGVIIEKYENGEKLTTDEKNLQVQILDNYLEYKRQSQYLQKLIRATSPDTRGTGKNIEELSYSLLELKETLEEDNFFGNIQPIFEDTFIGAFQEVLDVSGSAYSGLTLSQGYLKSSLDRIKNSLSRNQKNSAQREKVRRAVNLEFTRFIIMTAHKEGRNLGISIPSYFNDLMGKDNMNNTVKRLQNIRKGTDPIVGNSLKNNLLIEALIPILNRPNQDNIKMFNTKTDTLEENDYSAALDEIYAIDPDFAKSLAMITLIQSGKAVSPISYSKIIPNTIYQELAQEALESVNEGFYMPSMPQFEDQFYRNNPQFVPFLRYEEHHLHEGKALKTFYFTNDNLAKVLYAKTYRKGELVLYRNQGRTVEEGRIDKEGNFPGVRFAYDPTRQILSDGIWFHDYRIGDNLTPISVTQEEAKRKAEEC